MAKISKKKKEDSAKKEKNSSSSEKKRVRRTYIFAVGRRKTAVARVRYYKKGDSEILINGKEYQVYFPDFEFKNIVIKPLKVVGLAENFGKFSVKVKGGGKRGQAEAVSLGISRALEILDKKYRPVLKAEGLLRRDPRVKERKKYGLKRARRAPQWQKR